MKKSLALALLVAGVCLPSPLGAQPAKSTKTSGPIDLATARPGRDPNQPIDEEYTKKIKEYTTEAFFGSPLVDYLPASKTVPTPKAVLGDIAGAPGKLPYSKEVYDYMRRLEKATPRVKVYTIGKTEEGREMLAVAVASEALMKNLDATALLRVNANDHSKLGWLEMRYHWTGVDAAVQFQTTRGQAVSQYGLPPARQSVLALATWYF